VKDERPPAPRAGRVVVRSRRKVELIDAERIDWIDAAGNYVLLHVGPETHRLRGALAILERDLDPRQFLRIHRSTIVNVARVARVEFDRASDYTLVLSNGQRLTVGRSYRSRLQPLLQGLL